MKNRKAYTVDVNILIAGGQLLKDTAMSALQTSPPAANTGEADAFLLAEPLYLLP